MSKKFTTEERSYVMRQVKSSKNKSTELKLIAYFNNAGIKGWRRNYKLFGKPDFVFIKKKVAVFVDGCFWHGHHCRNLTPVSNANYWSDKQARNKIRDTLVNSTLTSNGWNVIRIWECELRNEQYIKDLFHDIL